MNTTMLSITENAEAYFFSNSKELLYVVGSILVYIAYAFYFNGKEFKASFDYDQNLKYKGKPLPSFPNGWYVALHSKDLRKGDAIAVDLAGENMVAFRSL